ncbi:rod-binding protein [Desulfosoma caldarium]|uniref:Rod binding protein n=1 Tax=Desulfosoma caldarium TaxID=610254 RepID=A0A3N1VLR4_9BACT|nr:rod-binding protein [Desulfosoma caldarium]ROR01901.1 rod binding protein [Desulfosoma caldarium]
MTSIRSIDETQPSAAHESFNKQKERLQQACMDFESLLTAQLVKSMRASVFRDEEPDHAMGIYESMLDEGLARVWSHQKSLGIAQWLYQSLEPLVPTNDK